MSFAPYQPPLKMKANTATADANGGNGSGGIDRASRCIRVISVAVSELPADTK